MNRASDGRGYILQIVADPAKKHLESFLVILRIWCSSSISSSEKEAEIFTQNINLRIRINEIRQINTRDYLILLNANVVAVWKLK